MQIDKASNKKLLKTKAKKVFILKQNKTANLKYIYTPLMKKKIEIHIMLIIAIVN